MSKICWVCDNCNWLTVSDSLEHHKMDHCRCGECGVDLEEGYCRCSGAPRMLAEIKDDKWEIMKNEK